MIRTYINGTLRNDINPEVGGSVSTTAAHVAGSKITVKVPVGNVEPQECDYIKLTDESRNLLNPAAGSLTGVGSSAAIQAISNGNFATDSNSDMIPDGFTLSNASPISLTGGELTFKATAQYGSCSYGTALTAGHRYFIRAEVKAFTSAAKLQITKGSGIYSYALHSGDGVYHTLSFIADVASGYANASCYIQDGSSSNWQNISVQNFMAIDMGTDSSNSFYNMTQYQMLAMVQKKLASAGYWEGSSQLGGVDIAVDSTGTPMLDGTAPVAFNIEISPVLAATLTANSSALFTMKSGQQYTLSRTAVSGSIVSGFFATRLVDTAGISASVNQICSVSTYPSTITAGSTSPSTSLQVGVAYISISAGATFSNYTFRLQLEQGSTETAWEQYYKNTVYAGVIRAADQEDMGFSPNLPYKLFDLTIDGNADLIAGVFVDLRFPAGATVQQVLLGNHSTDSWYNSAMGPFEGIAYRLEAEGIMIGTVDAFTQATLSESAYLWGSYISDVLDTLAGAAGAWWEITPDKVFNMRFSTYHPPAPFTLDSNAKIYDIQPSRDSYTMYSAVRVEGGNGRGTYLTRGLEKQGVYARDNIAGYTDESIQLYFPVFDTLDVIMHWGSVQNYSDYAIRIGWAGIDDSNPDIDMLATYGSATLKAANGFKLSSKWGTDPQYDVVEVSAQYYPLIPIMVRLLSKELAADIAAQRGGTGVVEYLLKDDTIIDFPSASIAGANFLQANGRRAVNVKFKTRIAGFSPGQLISNSNIPYYGVSGDYTVGAVTATIIAADDGSGAVIWEYEVEASSVAYRDPLKSMFYVAPKATFKLGDDVPVADGAYVENEVDIQTTITARALQPPTATAFEAQGLTAAQFEAEGLTCDQIENLVKEWDYMGHFLTDAARADIIELLNGGAAADTLDTRDLYVNRTLDASPWNEKYEPAKIGSPIISGSQAVTLYIIYAGDIFGNVIDTLYFAQSTNGRVNMEAPVSIDKTAANPLGDYTLTITKKDVIL